MVSAEQARQLLETKISEGRELIERGAVPMHEYDHWTTGAKSVLKVIFGASHDRVNSFNSAYADGCSGGIFTLTPTDDWGCPVPA